MEPITVFTQQVGKNKLIFDGAMGSQIIALQLSGEVAPENLNILQAKSIQSIHYKYLAAGSTCLTTNTFGINKNTFVPLNNDLAAIIKSAVANCRQAIKDFVLYSNQNSSFSLPNSTSHSPLKESDFFVFFDVGPTGELIYPLGDLPWDRCHEIFAEAIKVAAPLVDGIIIETMSDLREVKAAVSAAKTYFSGPILTTMTFEANGKTLTGLDPQAMCVALESWAVDGLGMNCSTGPVEMKPLIEGMLDYTSKPLIIQPNAGMPVFKPEGVYYSLQPEQYASLLQPLAQENISILGGCCGTTPEYIQAVIQQVKLKQPQSLAGRQQSIQHKNMFRITGGRGVLDFSQHKIQGGKIKLPEDFDIYDVDLVAAEIIDQALDMENVNLLVWDTRLLSTWQPHHWEKIIDILTGQLYLPMMIHPSNPSLIPIFSDRYVGKVIWWLDSLDKKRQDAALLNCIQKRAGAGCFTVGKISESMQAREINQAFQAQQKVFLPFGLRAEDLVGIVEVKGSFCLRYPEQVREIYHNIKKVIASPFLFNVINTEDNFPLKPALESLFKEGIPFIC